MKIAVLHGSPRKANTYFATKIFMDGRFFRAKYPFEYWKEKGYFEKRPF